MTPQCTLPLVAIFSNTFVLSIWVEVAARGGVGPDANAVILSEGLKLKSKEPPWSHDDVSTNQPTACHDAFNLRLCTGSFDYVSLRGLRSG